MCCPIIRDYALKNIFHAQRNQRLKAIIAVLQSTSRALSSLPSPILSLSYRLSFLLISFNTSTEQSMVEQATPGACRSSFAGYKAPNSSRATQSRLISPCGFCWHTARHNDRAMQSISHVCHNLGFIVLPYTCCERSS